MQWTRVLYSVVITRQYNPPISQFNSLCNQSRVSCQCVYTIYTMAGKLFILTWTDTDGAPVFVKRCTIICCRAVNWEIWTDTCKQT